ncbi:transcriptional regulator [Bacillus obstructivus]|nr:transcriptional regulator [Bacillus obstructivus]
MTVTIKHIANIAGVSYSTVSKALNNSPLVKSETKNKILKIAKELGYEPNYAAQQLVSKQSKVIGLIWPTLERIAHSTLVSKINDEIVKNSYSMILSINSIPASLEMFKRFGVDGVIIFDEHNQKKLEYSSVPMVTYGVGKLTSVPVIDVNYQEALKIAVEYLYQLGHQKICYIGDFSPVDHRQLEKYYGFKEAMERYELEISNENLINTAGLSWYDGYSAAKKLLQTSYRPTAIIGSSYDLSAGIVRALREENYIIPKDVSVISYDNIPQMANMEIPLTSVGVSVDIIAHHIVKTLLAYMNDKDLDPQFLSLTPALIERNSCAQAGLRTNNI